MVLKMEDPWVNWVCITLFSYSFSSFCFHKFMRMEGVMVCEDFQDDRISNPLEDELPSKLVRAFHWVHGGLKTQLKSDQHTSRSLGPGLQRKEAES